MILAGVVFEAHRGYTFMMWILDLLDSCVSAILKVHGFAGVAKLEGSSCAIHILQPYSEARNGALSEGYQRGWRLR